MTREEKIEKLLQNDLDDISQEMIEGNYNGWTRNILTDGWKGYNQLTDQEIDSELTDRELDN